MNSQASEYSIQRNYIELILDLPWNKYSDDNFDIKRANKILDRDHYGLKDVKDRILEQIAVLKLKKNMKSPILCFYGPPGVGKTSLGKSISEALGREYVRISLGGLRDEAELRGHRKTYIGAMPGRIIQNLKKVKTSNPVFILDEIDKLSVGSQGDPSSALLEILDPEQNNEFYDNFLELGYDLSKILFIATANNLNSIQPALLDRMELINLSGYSLEEKINIAKKHLISKQLKANGLEDFPFKLDSNYLKKIIQGYTRESGVRNLEKCIAKICRSYAKQIVENNLKEINSEKLNIEKVLGVPVTKQDAEKNNLPGISTGLAWTQYGGEILYIESIISKGKGGLTITGNLGKVMKESATIALEFIKSNCATFGINPDIFHKYNIHLHVPEGATPKDGPSAGITILTSLISLLTQRKVKNNFAMSGEITLRGKVLPVGGIKEKVLAAKRANVKEIEDRSRKIEQKKEALNSERILLTNEMIDEIEEEIICK